MDANRKLIPATLEACVMRISDIIAYLGKRQTGCGRAGINRKGFRILHWKDWNN